MAKHWGDIYDMDTIDYEISREEAQVTTDEGACGLRKLLGEGDGVRDICSDL